MISYLPSIYPDELLYSWFSRYYAHSGYPSYVMALEDLLTRRTGRINYEFSTELNSEAKQTISRYIPQELLVINHTMFPYYARFAPWDRRNAAIDVLTNGNANVSNLLPIPKAKGERFLMFCPECASEDRSTYGEAYFHRSHQIRHINICFKHGCNLYSTGLRIHGNASPRLFVPEEVISSIRQSENTHRVSSAEFQQYTIEVFNQPLNMNSQVPIGEYLTHKLRGTPYISTMGCMRHIAKLHQDLSKVFLPYPYQEHHLQKLFLGYCYDPHLIMMIGKHLGISSQELSNPILTQESSEPKQLPRTRARSSYSTRAGAQTQDWDKIDRNSLPTVRDAIKLLHMDSTGRPRRVTARAICNVMGWPSKRLELLPLCNAEVQRFHETMPQYWAREIVWAYNLLTTTNNKVNWYSIRNLTNIRRRNLKLAQNQIANYTCNPNCKKLLDRL